MEKATVKCPCRDVTLSVELKLTGSVGSTTAVHAVDLHSSAVCLRCGRSVQVSKAMVRKLIKESFKG